MNTEKVIKRDQKYIMHTYARSPLVLEHGEGMYAYDADGKAYLDFTSGIGVNALGYCHPAWVQAVTMQATRLQHSSNLYYTAPCGKLAKRLCARTGKSTADVAVIPQYCEDFYAVPQHDAALEAQFAGRFNVVFTGTFTPAQSLDMVIRAVLDARAAGAEHLHLLLVGDGMSREALQKQAADLHAGDAVTFYGSVPATDVPRFTALADALLISLSDSPDLGLTVPGKLASYMAAAKPVLASMNGAGYAAVLESGGGLVSPACDQKALADNMLALYRMTDAERAALGAKAKAYYTAHYRRAELLKRLEEFTVKGV